MNTPQSGSSLVGLLVGLALGLLVVGLAVQSFAYFASAARTQQVQAATATSQRIARQFLSAQARNAGGLLPVSTTDRHLLSPTTTALRPSVVNANGDVLNVAQPATVGMGIVDCLGRTKAVGGQMQSSFWVSGKNLRCRPSNESGNQPLSAGWARMTGEVAVATPVGIQWLPLASAPLDGVLAFRLCLTVDNTSRLTTSSCPLTHRTRTR